MSQVSGSNSCSFTPLGSSLSSLGTEVYKKNNFVNFKTKKKLAELALQGGDWKAFAQQLDIRINTARKWISKVKQTLAEGEINYDVLKSKLI